MTFSFQLVPQTPSTYHQEWQVIYSGNFSEIKQGCALGHFSEQLIQAFIHKEWKKPVLQAPFKPKRGFGDIDLIVQGTKGIHFIEVRSSESLDWDELALSVNAAKKRNLKKTAILFWEQNPSLVGVSQFDVFLVKLNFTRNTLLFRYYPEAFE